MRSLTWLDRDEGWELVRAAAINSLETSHRHSSPNHDRSYRILSISEDKIVVERIGRDRKPQQQPLTRKTVCDMIDVLNEHPGGCKRTKLNDTFYKTNLLVDLHPRLRLEDSGRVTVVPGTSASSSAIRARTEPVSGLEAGTRRQDTALAPKALDLAEPPGRVSATINRICRDTAKARRVKELHEYRCQIKGCRHTIRLPNGLFYAEAHHVRPLGGKHKGHDVEANILCVCPNHHAKLDLGVIEIFLSDLRKVDGHEIGKKYVDYHNRIVARRWQKPN